MRCKRFYRHIIHNPKNNRHQTVTATKSCRYQIRVRHLVSPPSWWLVVVPPSRSFLYSHWLLQTSVTGVRPLGPFLQSVGVLAGLSSVCEAVMRVLIMAGGSVAVCPSPATQTRLKTATRSGKWSDGREKELGHAECSLRTRFTN